MLSTKNLIHPVWPRICVLFLVCITVIMCFTIDTKADSLSDVPYTTYTYWEGYSNKKAVKTKATHIADKVISGHSLGIGAFSELQYMSVYNDYLYVLDSGNSRIVKMDKQYNVVEQITGFNYEGETLTFKGAKGIMVDESGLYVADTANKRVLCTENGIVKKIITRPQDSAISDTFDFAPTRLVRDSSGYIYLLCEGSYYGMMVYSDDLEFFGFFGANNVTVSLSSAVKSMFQSLFETEEKHNASVKQLPYTLLDICIDSEGFVTALNGEVSGQIRRFGLAGTNTLTKNAAFKSNNTDSYNFADYPVAFTDRLSKYNTTLLSSFCALTADSEGFYYAVDDTHGRIFVYDTASNVISVFGGGKQKGNQLGTFVSPSSICVFGEDLLVSDFSTGGITCFKRTEYGKTLMTADALTVNSHYEEAKPYWESIYAEDKNCQLAYTGLAKAALRENNYKAAMSYAKTGLDRETYALAFEKLRNQFISDNFWWIALLGVALVSLLAVFIVQSRKRQIILIKNPKLRVALRTPFHPFESFQNIKYKAMGSVCIATAVMLLFYVSAILSELHGGFMFKVNDLTNFNSALILLGTVGVVVLWTVSNWLVCILMNGKGKIKQIYCATCYCLLPLIIYNFVYLICSNAIIPSSNSPFELFSKLCYIVTAILLLLSISVIHDFSFFKAIGAALITLIGMAIVAFVLFAMLTLWQQLLQFVFGIYNEVALR